MKGILTLSMIKTLIVLVLASIQTLKTGNKKCGKEEVYRLVNDSLNNHVTREVFDSMLNAIMTATQ